MSAGIINPRNERFRLIAFQNIQKFSNPPSINIFLVRRKLMRFWKNRMNSIKIEAKSEPEPWFCVHIQILLWILDPVEKPCNIFCGIFLTYPNTSKSYGIRFLATKQHFQCPEIRIFHDFTNFYHFGDVFEHGWSQIPSQNSAATVSDTVAALFWDGI